MIFDSALCVIAFRVFMLARNARLAYEIDIQGIKASPKKVIETLKTDPSVLHPTLFQDTRTIDLEMILCQRCKHLYS